MGLVLGQVLAVVADHGVSTATSSPASGNQLHTRSTTGIERRRDCARFLSQDGNRERGHAASYDQSGLGCGLLLCEGLV